MKRLGSIIIIAICIILLTNIAYSAKTIYVEEADLVKLDLETHDPDGDELTYIFEEPLDENGEWQTEYGDEGEYNIIIAVSDGITEIKDYVVIVVTHKNRAPEIKDISDIIIKETETIEINPVVTDYENDPITIKISGITGEDGIWETGYDDAGEYTATITASDETNTVSKDVNIIIEETNRAPVIDSSFPEQGDVEINENENLVFAVSAADLDENELTYSWFMNGVDLEINNKSYEFITDYEFSGEYNLSAIVSDGEEKIKVEWNIDVLGVNRAPLIESYPEDVTVKEGGKIEIDFSASDPDEDLLQYKISEPVGNDKIWETTNYDAGEYNIDIIISDGNLNTSTSFKITVEDVNVAPIIEDIKDIIIYEGETLELDLNITDPDGDEISVEARNLPEGAVLEGTKIIFSPGYDFIKHNSAQWLIGVLNNENGKEFDVKLIASDEKLSSKKIFKITVMDKNQAPILGEIESELTMDEMDEIVIEPSYSDPDGDKITIHISDPIGDDGRWRSTYEDAGIYDIRIVATDGTDKAEQSITLTINNINRAPYFENNKNLFEINENETIEIIPVIKDPDGGIVELSAQNIPDSASFIDGIFTWTPGFDTVKEQEKFTITFTADDNETTTIENFDIIVNNINRAPEILNASQDKTKIYVGETITFNIDAVDLDSDELTYDWHFRMFDSQKDGSALRRKFTVPGIKEILVTVSDGKKSVEHKFKAEVYETVKEVKQEEVIEEEPVKKPEPIKEGPAKQPIQQKKEVTIVAYVIEHEEEKKDSGFKIVTM